MPDKRDYYEILGVGRDASEADIKKNFRKLAKENHPDLNAGDSGAETRFKEINEAYEVLSDPEKKARYDQFGHAGVDPSYGGGGYGGGYSSGFGGFGDEFDLGSIFESFFGGGTTSRSRNAPQRGESLKVSQTLTFEEAAFGCEKEITVNRIERCDDCAGTGAERGTFAETCSSCKGTGTVKTTRQTPLGMFSSSSPCPHCSGSGRIIKSPCKSCRGMGNMRKQKKISISIPAGIDHGQTISLRGQGGAGKNGGPSGDVLIVISIRPHPLFTRDGTSIYCDFPVTFVQAALGAELEVPTLDGKVKYTMPEGTQSGTVFRLKGKGIPVLDSKARGDQFVKVVIEVPKNLNDKQKELLRAFGAEVGENNHSQGKSFFDKLRDTFK